MLLKRRSGAVNKESFDKTHLFSYNTLGKDGKVKYEVKPILEVKIDFSKLEKSIDYILEREENDKHNILVESLVAIKDKPAEPGEVFMQLNNTGVFKDMFKFVFIFKQCGDKKHFLVTSCEFIENLFSVSFPPHFPITDDKLKKSLKINKWVVANFETLRREKISEFKNSNRYFIVPKKIMNDIDEKYKALMILSTIPRSIEIPSEN